MDENKDVQQEAQSAPLSGARKTAGRVYKNDIAFSCIPPKMDIPKTEQSPALKCSHLNDKLNI